MSFLMVIRCNPALPTPAAANSMPSPIEHIPCCVEVLPSRRVRFALLPPRGWSSRIPVLKNRAGGKMPSTFFHVYVPEGVTIPEYQIRLAEEFFDLAAEKFTKLHGEEREIAGRATPAKQPAQAAFVPPPVGGKARSFLPLPVKTAAKAPTMPKVEAKAKVEAKPIVEVKPKSVLKPTRKINVDEYVRHCTKGSPDQRGLPSPSESIANSTMSRYPLSEWDMDRLPIDMPDRFKKLAFKRQESKETSDLEAQPTKVIFHDNLVKDSWTATGRAVIRNHAVVRYRLKSKA